MALEFEYRIAPIGKVRRVSIEEHRVRLLSRDGQEVEAINFDDVRVARFVETSVRGIVTRRLELSGKDHRFRLSLSGVSGMDASKPPLSTFYEAGAALLNALAAARPDLEVELCLGRRMRTLLFSIGVFAMLLGLGILVAALATGVRSEKLLAAALPLAILLLTGLKIARSNRPWAASPRIPTSILGHSLKAERSGEAGRS